MLLLMLSTAVLVCEVGGLGFVDVDQGKGEETTPNHSVARQCHHALREWKQVC